MSLDQLPRILGAFSILWAVRDGFRGTVPGPLWTTVLFYTLMTAWLVAGVSLLRNREVSRASILVIFLAVIEMVALHPTAPMALQWFVWSALILLATPRHIDERAYLLRIFVSVVYLTAAVSKVNPPWLAGDSLAVLPRSRTHLEPLVPLLTSDVAPVLAVLTIALEAGVVAMLWMRPTRRLGVAVGIGLHAILVVMATTGFVGLINLVVLNGGLVALYPSFFHRGTVRTRQDPHRVARRRASR